MKIIIALATGLMATGALAQTSTMQTTTTRPAPMMEHHETTTRMRHSETHMSGNRNDMMRHQRMHRVCHTRWHHGHKIRTCTTRRWR